MRTMASVLVAVLLAAVGVSACPFYQDTVPESNYTSVTDALAAAAINGLPIRVCDGATTPDTEAIPPITTSVAFIGDSRDTPNGGPGYWLFENLLADPIFLISADAVSFENINVVFQETFARIITSGYVDFTSVTFMGGRVAVDVQSTNTGDASTGMNCLMCSFDDIGTGIIYTSGDAPCTQCVFLASRDAGITSRLNTADPFTNIPLFFVNFIDVKNPLIRQTAPAAAAIPVITSKDYNFARRIYVSRTFEDECPGFGAGAESGAPSAGTCPPVLGKEAQTVLMLVALAVFIIALFVCLFNTQRKRKTYITIGEAD